MLCQTARFSPTVALLGCVLFVAAGVTLTPRAATNVPAGVAPPTRPSTNAAASTNQTRAAVKPPPEPFEFQGGDRVLLLGDALIEGDQDYGYVEAVLTAHAPDRSTTFRNCGAAAGLPGDLWATGTGEASKRADLLKQEIGAFKPTVAILGYGLAAALQGEAGLGDFTRDLGRLMEVLPEVAGGKIRFVLLGPLGYEPSTNLPPPAVRFNETLGQYRKAIETLATNRNALFISLPERMYARTRRAPGTPPPRYNSDGFHLNELGFWRLSGILQDGLRWRPDHWWMGIMSDGKARSDSFGMKVLASSRTTNSVRFVKRDDQLIHPHPSELWTASSRTGGPCRLQYQQLARGHWLLKIDDDVYYDGNHEDWQKGIWIGQGPQFEQAEELRQTIVRKNQLLRRRRDSAAAGLAEPSAAAAAAIADLDRAIGDLEKRVATLRQPRSHVYLLLLQEGANANLTVSSNKVVSIPRKTTLFATNALPVGDLQWASGFEAGLFAQNPLIGKPLQIQFDPQGRLWVATSPDPASPAAETDPDDKVVVLEDTDADGRADRSTVFLDGLWRIGGVLPAKDGAYVLAGGQLWFCPDANGDGKADRREVLATGLGTDRPLAPLHALTWGPDGRVVFSQSASARSRVESPAGLLQVTGGGVWSFEGPTGGTTLLLRGPADPRGLDFDVLGRLFVSDRQSGGLFLGAWPGDMSPAPLKLESKAGASGIAWLDTQQFPEDWQGDLLVADAQNRVIRRHRLQGEGALTQLEAKGELVRSSAPTFRPFDLRVGPDGALYVADWASAALEDTGQPVIRGAADAQQGRIWRVTAKGRPLLTRPDLKSASAAQLREALRSPDRFPREQARRRLVESGTSVEADVKRWAGEEGPERLLLETLWLCEALDLAEPKLLQRLESSKEPCVRAQARRLAADWDARKSAPVPETPPAASPKPPEAIKPAQPSPAPAEVKKPVEQRPAPPAETRATNQAPRPPVEKKPRPVLPPPPSLPGGPTL